MSAIDTLLNVAPRYRDGMRQGPNHIMIRCPFHGGGNERTPSLSISLNIPVWFCLAGETKVLTREGPREIRELAGSEHDVLVPGGYWVTAPFYSFGTQNLYEITLSRNGIKKTVRATAEHRWFVRTQKGRARERVTTQLKSKDVLEGCFPVSLAARADGKKPIRPSPFGIARGITFGDGTALPNGNGSHAYLYGNKDRELLKWFPLCETYEQPEKERTIVQGLPSYYKTEIPAVAESVAYLYGWLAGYFAADGDISEDGTVNLNSVHYEDLVRVQALCARVGIATTGIKTYKRKGFNGVEPIHRLGLFSDTLPADFFLLAEHRKRFLALQKKYARKHWQVVSVSDLQVHEEVFCAVVAGHGAFALEDNILTGNCHGCKSSGHVAQLLAAAGLSRDSIDAVLPKTSGERYTKQTLGAKILKSTHDLFRGKYILDEGLLDAYRLCPTSLRQAGFKQSTLRHFEVGYDTTNIRITYPLRNVYGDLIGISGRANLEGIEPRYKIYDKELIKRTDFHVPPEYNMEAVKSAILWHGHVVRPLFFAKSHVADFMVITEGFKACMWTWQHGFEDVVALVGSYLTDHHAELIGRVVPRVVLFLDNNEAGWRGTQKAALKLIKKGVDVTVARYPDDREQPDDLAEEELQDALLDPEPIRAWTRNHPVAETPRDLVRKIKRAANQYEDEL